MTDRHTRVLLVSGSTRAASTNTAALRTAATLAPAGLDAVLYTGLADLPAFTPDADPADPHPAVRALRDALDAADAVLFCTPEYAGALPGSFKNLIDWTVGTGDLYRKPVAWINVAADGRGDGAHTELATVCGYVDADIVTTACRRLYVARDAVTADGTVTDAAVRAGLADTLTALAAHIADTTWPA